MFNISFNFDFPEFDDIRDPYNSIFDKEDLIKDIQKTCKSYSYCIQSAVEKAADNRYEYEILKALVNSTVNEFIYGLADRCAKKGVLLYHSKVSKYISELEKKIKGEFKQIARSAAGMNYHIIKG